LASTHDGVVSADALVTPIVGLLVPTNFTRAAAPPCTCAVSASAYTALLSLVIAYFAVARKYRLQTLTSRPNPQYRKDPARSGFCGPFYFAAGEDDAQKLAQMARKGLRKKVPELQLALEGRIRDHHRFLLRQLFEELTSTEEKISQLERRMQACMRPYQHVNTLWTDCRHPRDDGLESSG
jgi:hypothetical protein